MSLLRSAIRSRFALQTLKPSHGLPLFLRQSPKHFSSTEAEQPPASTPRDDSSTNPFLRNTGDGRVYANLYGVARHTLKTDILNLLEGCNLGPDDIKFSYSAAFHPLSMMLQFPSRQAFDSAFKAITRKGNVYRLEKADRSQWDVLMPYDGKTVLLQGLPRIVSAEDIERFLSGCVYEQSSIQFVARAGLPKIVLIQFPTRTAALNAYLTKNRAFCHNNQISVRVLQ